MQIGASTALTWLSGVWPLNASATAASSSPAKALPEQLTLGQNAPTFTGFKDYTQLGASGTWQFNLAGVLQPSTVVQTQAVSPEQEKAEAADIKQAFDLINQSAYDDARALMNALLAKNKTNAAALHALGYADFAEGKYAEAEKLFLRAHALNSTVGYDNDAQNARLMLSDDDTVLARARAWVASPSKRGDAIRVLIALTDRSPDNTAAHELLGEAMLDEGDGNNGLLQFAAAIRNAEIGELSELEGRLTQLADEAPQSAFIQQLIGQARLRMSRFEDALESLTRAYDLASDKLGYTHDLALAHIGVGETELARGNIDTAMLSFLKAKDLDPTARETKHALAKGYIAEAEQHTRRRNYAKAAETYTLAAGMLDREADPDLRKRAAQGAYAVGLILQRARIAAGEDVGDEVVAFQAAYDLDPDDLTHKRKLADVRNALGDQLFAAGEFQEAAGAYRRALDLFKYDKTYKANTIKALVAYGDNRLTGLCYDDAVKSYLEAYKLDTYDVNTKQKLANAYNARGLNYQDEEDFRAAVKDFKAALQLFPDNVQYQANYDALKAWDY